MQQQQQPMMMVNVMPIEQPLPVSPVPLPPLPPAPEQDRVIPASVESTERTERLIKEQEEIEDKSLLEWTNIADKIAAGLVPPENRLQLIELLEAFVAENQQNPAKLAAEPQLAKVVGTISNSLSKLKQVQPTPVPQPPAPVPQQTTNIAYQQPTPVPIQPRPVYQQQYPMQRPMMMPMQTIPHQPYPVHPQFIQPAGMVQPRPVGIMQAQPGMIQPAGMMPQYVNPMMQASQYFPIGAAAQMANLTPVPLLNVQPAFQQQQTPALKQQPARTKRTAAATAATVPETATPSQQQGRQKKQRTVAAVKDNPLLIAHTLPSRSTLSYADIDSSPEKPKSKSTGKKAKQTPAAPVGRPSESLLSYADLDDAPEPGEVLSSSEND